MTTLTRPRVTVVDLLWLAWRRHRTSVLVTAGLVAVVAATMVVTGSTTGDLIAQRGGPLGMVYYRLLWRPLYVNMLFGLAIAVFWGAPLVAREHEARTNLVVWGQDVSATRWLAGQLALLGAVATGLAAVIWLSMRFMVDAISTASGGNFHEPFTSSFEVAPQAQIGYTLFGFALGVAAGAVTRRVVPAMAVALIGFTVVRVAIVQWARERYLPPVHTFEAWNTDYQPQVPDYALYVASGYADANGVPIGNPDWTCEGVASNAWLDCVKSHGVAGHYAEFQPLERLGLFQWIEAGIFLVLAAGLLVLAWWWLKRARRV